MYKRITVLTSLYNCQEYLEGYFDSVLNLSSLDGIEFLLIHNEPKQKENEIISSYTKNYNDVFRYISVVKKENLYTSWNRGIKIGKGEYFTLWNVDDIRCPDSIERQIKILDDNNNCFFTYGDIINMPIYGVKSGKVAYAPDFDSCPKEFLRSYFCGCFPMWKKVIHDKIGFFDEQFHSAGDFDLFIRAACNFNGKKTPGILGYYLTSSGISKSGNINNIERTVIELRYGIYDKIDYRYYNEAMEYRIHEIKKGNKWIPISNIIPNYEQFIDERKYLLPVGKRKHYIQMLKQSLKLPFKMILTPRKFYFDYFNRGK